eukprot:CAMPEP_0204038306 /NCGR_PEP_ID=MMETSP0360-20130528/86889_1 /ASSEMBLY_ACC=CAM_ASM_000342 /TAXON_ID=268821 /ORGANISM="Scrippsiella Hangoei, Strain SHTV-5" /LENGTH=67 /DNA_ID=CAMNT_0050983955 /DNA_START=26 /DNA_END=226 /DNA_ORIENTATION=-
MSFNKVITLDTGRFLSLLTSKRSAPCAGPARSSATAAKQAGSFIFGSGRMPSTTLWTQRGAVLPTLE